MDFKDQPMTDEYALQYALKQGYLAGRIEMMSLREEIAKDILLEYDGDDREVWLTDILSRCADIARGKSE